MQNPIFFLQPWLTQAHFKSLAYNQFLSMSKYITCLLDFSKVKRNNKGLLGKSLKC